VFRHIRTKLFAALAVPLAVLVAVAGLQALSNLKQISGANEKTALLVIGGAGLVLGLFIVALVSRSVSRPLVDLSHQAEELATTTLPAMVQAILDAGASGGEPPAVPKVKVNSRDEVARMALALDAVNKTAVELAVGQANLRRNLSDAFVNLGRRNQNLVTRQLEYISEIELKEADPESLEELFRLDHLATRMRRNAESLLILAGSGPARQWSAAVPAMDVARAASAEVEDYKRLRLHHFDAAMITGAATTDLVHILAELTENALTFSPPGSPVDVYGRFLEGGYVIVIVDAGIGMSADDLETANGRLEGHGANNEVPGRYLGHFVAGRLASRHDITISLQSSHSGGLVARVKIPSQLIEDAVPDLSAVAEVRSAPVSPALDPARATPTMLGATSTPAPTAPALAPPNASIDIENKGGKPGAGSKGSPGPATPGAVRAPAADPSAAPSKPAHPSDEDFDKFFADRSVNATAGDDDKGGQHFSGTTAATATESSAPAATLAAALGGALASAAAPPAPLLPAPPQSPAKAASPGGGTLGHEVPAAGTVAPANDATPGAIPSLTSWDPLAAPTEAQPDGAGPLSSAAASAGPSRGFAPLSSNHLGVPTPDLGILSALAGTPAVGGGLLARSHQPSQHETSGTEQGPASATGTPATAASWNALATPWDSPNGPATPAPSVGPAAQARSTAEGLRKLTRRVPGASLPQEDESLRRDTPTTTSRNPNGLTGALSQYLSATANEGRPEKEHNSR
jgi:signal transduction histidine kinase